ncbi:L-threonylcarbamoyladenylate synthase [Pararhizobium sp. IMCC21322]|uniref:L-threonylcarbamoyladenylate synthase n=1 Tax=Pararhizobium sp. IMCC21322 TaxID=3067903 RepID=UPI0027420A2E|nr:L-threonylcarbamoyladenylate synthase [Pararhizobium sp. IMCC21322]
MSQTSSHEHQGLMPQGPEAAVAALALLAEGQLVGLPTETVYGLAADATSDRTVAQIYAAKGRPSFNPLICHVDGVDMAHSFAHIDERAHQLIKKFWPGGLTLVLPRKAGASVSELAIAGLETIALRCPDSAFTRSIISQLQRPLAAPSANPSGLLSPTRASDVRLAFPIDTVPLVVDGGPCPVGLESTIVACCPGAPLTLLRPGAVTREQLEAALHGEVLEDHRATADDQLSPSAPGMLTSHYAPRAKVCLSSGAASHVGHNDAVLTFAGHSLPGQTDANTCLDLSRSGDCVEAAANLFSMLRRLDALHPDTIHVVAPPRKGLGVAIYDRLQRASAPRNNDKHDL